MPGSVTLKNVAAGPAPRSMAASSRLRSKPANRAFTTTTAYDTENATWARMMVRNPRRSPRAAKSRTRDEARTISGTTMGSVIRASRAACLRKRWRKKARAAAVPTTVQIKVLAAATIRLLRSEERIWGLAKSLAYHARVKPSHAAVSRPRLNEKTTRTRRGA